MIEGSLHCQYEKPPPHLTQHPPPALLYKTGSLLRSPLAPSSHLQTRMLLSTILMAHCKPTQTEGQVFIIGKL